MVSTARRALVLVLLLSLALTACGRAGPRVTADDGRSIDRPGSGLWIPETRGGDVDDDVRTLDADDEDEGEDENGRDDGTEPADDDVEAAAPRTSSDTTSDEPRALEPPAPRRPAADDRAPAPTPAPEPPGDGGDAAPRVEQVRGGPEKEAQDEDDVPAEPEVVLAECDALRDGQPPEDLPRAVRSTEGRYVASVDHAANGLLVAVEEPTERLLDAFRERYTPRLQLTEGRFDEDGALVVVDEQ